MHNKQTSLTLSLALLLGLLIALSTSATFIEAQSDEQPADPNTAANTELTAEPLPPVEPAQPQQPPAEGAQAEQPAEQPVVPPADVVLPTTQPVEPVMPPTVPVAMPTQAPPAVTLPYTDTLDNPQNWLPSGSWSFVDSPDQGRHWFASTVGQGESALEFALPIQMIGVGHPQLVLRQQGVLNATDIVTVEVQPEGSGVWLPVSQQPGNSIAGQWADQYIDVGPFIGQTLRLRVRVAGGGSTGYWLDQVTLQEFVTPPVATVAPEPVVPVDPVSPQQPQAPAQPMAQPMAQPLDQSANVAPLAAAPANAYGTGLYGEYFGNKTLSGTPVTRIDPEINFYWHVSAPIAGVPADGFSVRWTGRLVPRYSEIYTFYAESDDGVRLWVNGQLLVNSWIDRGPTTDTATMALTAGQPYDIRVEYYDGGASATMTLWWSSPSQAREIIPASQLFPASGVTNPPAPTATTVPPTQIPPTQAPPTATFTQTNVPPTATLAPTTVPTQPPAQSGGGLLGEYFNNRTLSGTPVTRIDPEVNFYWHASAPIAGVNADNFSARWTGQIVPRYTETYTIYAESDDGVRVWIDGRRIINSWKDRGPTTDTALVILRAGQRHDIRVEYYDGTGSATMTLWWSSRRQAKQIIPASQMIPAGVPANPVQPTQVPPTLVPPTQIPPTQVPPTQVPPTATFTPTRIPPTATFTPTHVPPTATLVPTNVPTQPPAQNGTGLYGEYFANKTLSGTPVTRIDPEINFYWHDVSPIAGIAKDNYSVRWTGQVVAKYSETYTFYTESDDGVRLWINGQQLVNSWVDRGPTTDTATIRLQAGQRYDIRVEYYEGSGYATMTLWWSSPSQYKQIIPASQLFPASAAGSPPAPTATTVPPTQVPPTQVPPTATFTPTRVPPTATLVPTNVPTQSPAQNGTGLYGEYFANKTLSGTPVTRIDPEINFYWHDVSPIAGVAKDNYSVRWTGQVVAKYSETYTIYAESDDGVRVWVNGQQLINSWVNRGPTTDTATINLQAGQRYDIRVEYYEGSGYATMTLWWSSPSQYKQIIPASQLFPAQGSTNPQIPPTATNVPPATTTPLPAPTTTPVPSQPSGIPAPPQLPAATGNVIALWDWSDPNIRIYPQPNGAVEIGPVSSNDVAPDGQGAHTRIVSANNGDRIVEFMVNHDYVRRPEGTAARLFIRNWGYLQPYYGREIQTDFYMYMPTLPEVPVNNPNLVYGLGQQFKHADGVIWAMDAERAADGSGVSPYVWWPRGSGVVKPRNNFEYQAGVWHRVQINSLLHNSNGWLEIRIDDQLVFRADGNVSELWGGGIGLALYIRDIRGEVRTYFSDWRLQVK